MSLGGPRPRSVLARLLLDGGRVVSADTLVEDVWNGRPPPTAGKTLQKYVSELRKALGDATVRTGGQGYAVEDADLDARRFEGLVVRAQAAQDRGDAEAAERLAGQAEALWRGAVLADLPEARFADAERTRLEDLRLLALEVRYGAELARGHHSVAAPALAELVEAHPLREGLWALFLRALYGSGRQAEALRAFERHRRFLADELGIEPSPELRRLDTAILRHELASAGPPASTPGNLPHALSSFVGRRRVLEELAAALAVHRLITLTGPGGVGKTRLALEAAPAQVPRHPGGTWVVDLAPVGDSSGVTRAVADALAVEDQPGQGLTDTLTAVLAHRPPTLIILDNCEHVAGAAGELAGAILRRASSARLLATSRVPLGVEGECVRSVAPMDDEEAVDLFTARAGLAAPGFSLTAGNRRTVDDICRRLDGLPLAIELAASQLRVLEPLELAGRLDERFQLLASPRTASPRQRTLLATVQRSYELLSPSARQVFDRLAVLPGSFTLEAAEAICAGAGIAVRDVLGLITELVDHSLVVREPGPRSVARYRLLDTLRLFGRHRLEAEGAIDDVSRFHADFLLRLAQTAAPHFYAPGEPVWRVRLQAEEHNLRAALEWASAHDRVLAHRLAAALWSYWDVRWQERYATDVLRPLLAAADPRVPPELRARALTVAADLAANTGEARNATTWADEAVGTFRRLGDRRGLVEAQLALGSALGNRGALEAAGRVLLEALGGARQLADDRLQARALQIMGFIDVRRGDLSRATNWHGEELAIWRRVGSVRGRATVLRRLAAIERDRRDLIAAESLCREALACMEELDDAAGIAHVRLTLADVARLGGHEDEASVLYTQGLEEVRAIGDRRCMASTFKNLATMATRAGDHVRASALFLDSLTLRHELGDDAGLAECLEGLGTLALTAGRHEAAATVLAAARGRRDASGALPPPAEREALAALAASVGAAMGADVLARAEERGLSLTPSEVVEYCRARFGRIKAGLGG